MKQPESSAHPQSDQKKEFEPIGDDEGKHIVVDTTKKSEILEKIFI